MKRLVKALLKAQAYWIHVAQVGFSYYFVDDVEVLSDSQSKHIKSCKAKLLDVLLTDEVLITHLETKDILPVSVAGKYETNFF